MDEAVHSLGCLPPRHISYQPIQHELILPVMRPSLLPWASTTALAAFVEISFG